jgi:Phospholipase B.
LENRRFKMLRKFRILLITVVIIGVALSGSIINGSIETRNVKDLLNGSYAYKQDGWLVVHLEGTPYQIGYQNGYLTAENANYWLLSYLGGPEDRQTAREIAQEFVWDKIPAEYQGQLKGIAAGLQAKGYDWDVWDVIACNQWADQEAFQAPYQEERSEEPEGCSAFITTGDATITGEIIIGHNTWCPYNEDFMYNVIYDVKPENGYSYRYQSAGASIWSGEDWYLNEAGLMLVETSIGEQPMNPEGNLHFTTMLYAVQYSDSIDEWFDTITANNNGGNQAEWLIGDVKTGEIASLQLLTTDWDFHRTFNGFFGSSNHLWSGRLRKLINAEEPDPESGSYARYIRWGQLRDKYYGKIDIDVGKLMLSDHYDTLLKRNAPIV